MVKTDKRKKLTDEQKDEITKLFNTTKLGDRKIAEQFGVSRRTVQFLRTPTKLVNNRETAKQRKLIQNNN